MRRRPRRRPLRYGRGYPAPPYTDEIESGRDLYGKIGSRMFKKFLRFFTTTKNIQV